MRCQPRRSRRRGVDQRGSRSRLRATLPSRRALLSAALASAFAITHVLWLPSHLAGERHEDVGGGPHTHWVRSDAPAPHDHKDGHDHSHSSHHSHHARDHREAPGAGPPEAARDRSLSWRGSRDEPQAYDHVHADLSSLTRLSGGGWIFAALGLERCAGLVTTAPCRSRTPPAALGPPSRAAPRSFLARAPPVS